MSPATRQQIRFCTSSDGVRIACGTAGSGPPLVKAANWLSHLEFDWDSPVWRHWIRELSRDHTLVRYDERGCGLSDWTVEGFSLDAWVRDLEAVVDALELERFPLLGISQGGPIAIAYTARHPERVSQLILYGTYSAGRSHWNLSGREREERELMLRMIEVGWGKDHPAFRQVFTSLFIPDATPEQADWFNELQRVSATPENAARMVTAFDTLDVRELARRLDVPTLVLHARGDLRIPFDEGRFVASLIPGARFVPLESRNHILLESEPAWHRFLGAVREFLGVPVEDARPKGEAQRTPPGPMTASRRRRIDAMFDLALELPRGERPAFLAKACGDDVDLRREVEALLAFAEQSGLTARLAGALFGVAAGGLTVSPGDTVSHYEIAEKLGGGGMGVVYKAVDLRLQRVVALKFLPPSLGLDPELKMRFAREAQAVASLDHPNLCTIFHVEESEQGQLFIVMPFYEGETLKQKLERGPLRLADALDYGIQIAGGLAHAHVAGVVHRDIKPANVVVTTSGQVKILDFGIAKVADMQMTQTGAVLGTLTYMSPEQACGERVDHRTDLWALGTVLYEMITGRPPFKADFPEALYYAIQWRDPAGMGSLRAGVPPALDGIIHRLLEKDPDLRYDDGGAVAAALESVRSESTGRGESAKSGARVHDAVPAGSASRSLPVGRDTEVKRLEELFRAASRGARQLVFVAGEPGIGKSMLVDMFVGRIRARGQLRIGSGQCLDQRGAGEPYMPVLEALGRLCRERGGADLIAVLERCAPTWVAQMPSLLDPARLEAAERRAFAATRERMLREMVEALEAFTADVPLVLVLEDLHWSDPSTLDLLSALGRRPEPAQLLVLATYRPGESGEGVAGLVRALASQGRGVELALDGWTDADAREYLAARFAPGRVPDGVVELALRRTEGHPLFLRSLVDAWLESGALTRDGAAWRSSVDLETLGRTVPETLRASIEQRANGLPAAHQELLEVASVAGPEFEVAAVAAALDRSDEEVELQLRSLARQGWVDPVPVAEWPDGTVTARFAFTHHLYRELLYDRLPFSGRARLHERIGRRLESAYADRAADRSTELALHFSLARDDERAVLYRRHAAEHALGRSAHAEAIGHLTAALDILHRRPDLPDAGGAELKLQRMLAPALLVTRGWGDADAERAYNRARELSELLDDSQQLANVLQGLAYVHEIRGDYRRSQSLLEERLTLHVPREQPGSLIEAHELLSCSLFHQGSFDAALRRARQGLDLLGPAQSRPFPGPMGENAGIACFYWAGLTLWFLGRADESLTLVHRAIEASDDSGHAYMRSLAEAQAARLFQLRRETDRVAEHAERAISMAERLGYPYQGAIARTLLGWADVKSGRTSSGLERLRDGLEGQAKLGAAMERPYSLALLADALAFAGERDAALARVGEALALPERNQRSFFWEAELHRLRGELLLQQGSSRPAEASMRQALQIAAGQGARALELRSALSLCRLGQATGSARDAPGILQGLLASFTQGFGTPDLLDARAALNGQGVDSLGLAPLR